MEDSKEQRELLKADTNEQQEEQPSLKEEKELKNDVEELESWTNIGYFFFLGILAFLHKETSLTAAQDILTGSDVATSTILIVSYTPLMVVKVTLPWFMQRIPYQVRITTAAIILALSYLLVGLGTSVQVRLLGVACGSTMHPLAEVTVLTMTTHFSKATMLAFSSGLGVSSLLANTVYTGKMAEAFHLMSPCYEIMVASRGG